MATSKKQFQETAPPQEAGGSEPPVKSIDKAMRLLKAIAAQPYGGATFMELSRETGFGKATAHRLLAALVDVGFVFQDIESRRYRLGSASIVLGRHAIAQEIAQVAQAALDRIASETGDTAFASVPEGRVALCIGRAVGTFPIRSLTLEIGDRRPLGVGAGSLALLAALTDAQVDKVLAWNEGGYRRYPGFDAAVIRKMLARTRKDGYALNEGHIVQGMTAIGVPVADASGAAVAALSLSAIADRVSGTRRKELVQFLQREASALRKHLPVRRGD